MRRLFLMVSVLLANSAAAAVPAGVAEAWLAGNRMYQDGDYLGAAEAYARVLEHGYTAPEVEYNLANALLRGDRLGGAVLHYRRALLLNGSYEDARHNLNYARSLTSDVKPDNEAGQSGLLNFLSGWRLGLLKASWMLVGMSLVLAGVAGIRRLYFPDRIGWQLLQGLAGFGVVLALLAVLFEVNRGSESQGGVIMVNEINVLAGPGEGHTVNFRLHEGSEVELLREAGQWQEVKVSDGLQGWVRAEAVEAVQPDA